MSLRPSIPLRLGPMDVPGFDVRMTSFRWLVPDGHACRPGEPLGWCRLGFVPKARVENMQIPFASEASDVQMALAPRVGGRITIAPGLRGGGWDALIPANHRWNPGLTIGHLEGPAGEPDDASGLRRLFVTGRRILFDIEDLRSHMLAGWFDRYRGWWADRTGPFRTLLSLGTCELHGIVRGEQGVFENLFQSSAGPAQVIYQGDSSLVPAAPVVLAGMDRARGEAERIGQDMLAGLREVAGGSVPPLGPTLNNWVFAHRLLNALADSPVRERNLVLGPDGIVEAEPPNAVLLTLSSESRTILRHKRLGYPLWIHHWRFNQAGKWIKAWLSTHFERVVRSIDDTARDVRTLVTQIQERTGAKVLYLNLVSSQKNEDAISYAGFEAPLSDHLALVRAKELNLMLADLARELGFRIVDVDALAAELGTAEHVPDGIHASGTLQDAVRSEMLSALKDAGLPNFTA